MTSHLFYALKLSGEKENLFSNILLIFFFVSYSHAAVAVRTQSTSQAEERKKEKHSNFKQLGFFFRHNSEI